MQQESFTAWIELWNLLRLSEVTKSAGYGAKICEHANISLDDFEIILYLDRIYDEWANEKRKTA